MSWPVYLPSLGLPGICSPATRLERGSSLPTERDAQGPVFAKATTRRASVAPKYLVLLRPVTADPGHSLRRAKSLCHASAQPQPGSFC